MKWTKYWSDSTSPKHASNDDWFYDLLASEIRFFLGELRDLRIAELGAGDGSITKRLDITKSLYTGVDFSSSMLNAFVADIPRDRLKVSDAYSFLEKTDNNSLDRIFSYGLLQYLSLDDIEQLFIAQEKVIKAGGMVGHFGVPISELRGIFVKGIGSTPAVNTNLHRTLFRRLASRYRNNIGYWHSIEDLAKLKAKLGINQNIYGNVSYFYRVNLIVKY